ncbi:hypothetical protein MTsPCn9_14790 [Croceitalea sp. MTPC9]|uniref:hypothetical protein n=1 Tax=unclassified Croceitalea TaxID=2632280 RepID=UPI002B39AC72|nr:hypothetical protein MTsPCn6_14340 [Croceitalea sp. MTPC6]GMN16543.1 hypothetical protein MTsPCn9_14790 [Croceitalea sp. MTPC9]
MKIESKKLTKIFILVLLMPSIKMIAQESKKVELIYGDWELSTKKSTDSLLIFHSKESNHFDKRFSEHIFSFKESNKGVLSEIKYSDVIYCYPSSNFSHGSEKWTIVKPLNRLERIFYDEEDELLYSCTYEISRLNKNVLELKLISEFFNENWVEKK